MVTYQMSPTTDYWTNRDPIYSTPRIHYNELARLYKQYIAILLHCRTRRLSFHMRNIRFFASLQIPVYRRTTIPRVQVSREMSGTNNSQVVQETPWHAAYPAPKSEAVGISQSELLAMMENGKEPGKDFILVDLRRNDHTVRQK
jgi:hypothetical protein